MQTQEGKKGNGLVKEEFQAAMKWLFVPLIMKDVEARAEAEAKTFGGSSMRAVIEEWRLQLRSCYKLLQEGEWESEHLNKSRKPAMKAQQAAAAAQATAERAMAIHAAWVQEAQLRNARATAARLHCQSEEANGTLFAIADALQKDAVVADRYKEAAQAQWAQAQHTADCTRKTYTRLYTAYRKQLMAYKPSEVPFFLMMDNCPSYSPFADKDKKNALPICPFLQVCGHSIDICNCSRPFMSESGVVWCSFWQFHPGHMTSTSMLSMQTAAPRHTQPKS